jgi:hypothetical protein
LALASNARSTELDAQAESAPSGSATSSQASSLLKNAELSDMYIRPMNRPPAMLTV